VAEPSSRAATSPEPTRRLFFALWPDETMREAMARATQEAARASGGRPVPAGNLHVTLAFLGSVPEGRLPELAAIGRRVAPLSGEGESSGCDEPGVELVFDHLEYWRGAHVLCALPARQPACAATLARRLQERLSESGFAPDPATAQSAGFNMAKPFRPHVTLARKALRLPRPMEMEAVTWRFAEFVLVQSKTDPEGAEYRVLESFTLGNE
jgi:RNA 2',3'-cyclic 3'-phosphodiesterase